jgi:hypothetical protein
MTTGSMATSAATNSGPGGGKKLDELDMILGIGGNANNSNKETAAGPASAPKVRITINRFVPNN